MCYALCVTVLASFFVLFGAFVSIAISVALGPGAKV